MVLPARPVVSTSKLEVAELAPGAKVEWTRRQAVRRRSGRRVVLERAQVGRRDAALVDPPEDLDVVDRRARAGVGHERANRERVSGDDDRGRRDIEIETVDRQRLLRSAGVPACTRCIVGARAGLTGVPQNEYVRRGLGRQAERLHGRVDGDRRTGRDRSDRARVQRLVAGRDDGTHSRRQRSGRVPRGHARGADGKVRIRPTRGRSRW